jgi:hypothetical protein
MLENGLDHCTCPKTFRIHHAKCHEPMAHHATGKHDSSCTRPHLPFSGSIPKKSLKTNQPPQNPSLAPATKDMRNLIGWLVPTPKAILGPGTVHVGA